MTKKKVMFSCVATAAFATFVGVKTLGLHTEGSDSLLKQNVEALSVDEYAEIGKAPYRGREECSVYFNGEYTLGRKAVCKSASDAETCVPGTCIVGD